jgi:hypothetical protein
MPTLHDLAMTHSLGKRDCYYNRYGRYVCNNWSTGARIGVGVAIAVGVIIFVLLISGLGMRRRRRMAASTQPAFNAQAPPATANAGYYNQSQPAYGQPGYQQPYQTGYDQYTPGGYGGAYGGGASYPPPQGYYSGQRDGEGDNPIGEEQRAYKTGGDVGQYQPPSVPPPQDATNVSVPPPTYRESGKPI